MLLADRGKTQTEICQILGCCAATARHWIHIARSGMAHKWRVPISRPKAVNEEYLEHLQELVSDSSRNYGYSFRRWTVNWLQKHLAKEIGVEISDRHIKRLLKQMDLSTLPKASNNQETTNNANNSKILIRDLKSDLSESAEPFNLPKLSIDSDIHGARHIQGIICATVQQYFGLFSFNSRISAHS